MKTITIPAPLNGAPGCYFEQVSHDTVFSVVSANGPFRVQVGNQPAQTGFAGLALGDPSGEALGSITLLNPGTAAVDVTFDTGTTAYKGATPSSPSDNFIFLPLFGNAGTVTGTRAIPTGNGAPILGTQTINGVSKTRQWIEITNLSSTDLIYVFLNHTNGGGQLDQCIGTVFTNNFRRFDVSKDLVLANISLNTIQCTAYEQY